MDVELLELDDPRWPALLTRLRHGVDHLPTALAAYDAFRGHSSQLLVVQDAEGVLAVPLRLLVGPGDSVHATSSEVRSSPIFSEGATARWRRGAIRELLDFLQSRGVVTLFLRLHPLLDPVGADFAPFGAIVDHGPTFDIPLDRPLAEIRAGMRVNHQRGIRKFHNQGLHCEPDTEWRYLEQFHRLYSLTMDRVGASDDYRFSLEFFEQLRDNLGEHLALWATIVDGQLAVGHLVAQCEGIAELLYVGVHPDYQRQVPQVGLYDSELAWAPEHGLHDYFLDGGAQESLRHFKAGLTKVQPAASSVRIVVDPVEYGRRCALWERSPERVVGRADEFFPPYLQPATKVASEPAHV